MNIRVWILLAVAALSALCTAADTGPYTVSEIVKIHSISDFDCRLSDYPYAPSVQFRVQIRDVHINDQLPADEASEFLSERLRNAEQVVLKNVSFRNYFRLIADVYTDGQNVRDELVELHLAIPDEAVQETEPDVSTAAVPYWKQRRYRPEAGRSGVQAQPRILRRTVSIQSLMESKVDLSAIDDETTLEDALRVISESVRPKVPFVVLWNDLESNALIDKDTPIGVSKFGRVKLKHALKIIFYNLSLNAPAKVILAIEGGVVTVGTNRGLIQKATVHSYSVSDLTDYIPFVGQMATQGDYMGNRSQ